jgi:hypothetical protein
MRRLGFSLKRALLLVSSDFTSRDSRNPAQYELVQEHRIQEKPDDSQFQLLLKLHSRAVDDSSTLVISGNYMA